MNRITIIPTPQQPQWEGHDITVNTPMRTVFDGYGGVFYDGRTLVMNPIPPDRHDDPADTHAALVTADVPLPVSGYKVSWRAKTVSQHRTPPAPWEVFWTAIDLLDDDHATAFLVKRNGWQLSRWDPTGVGKEIFLATGEWDQPWKADAAIGGDIAVHARRDNDYVTFTAYLHSAGASPALMISVTERVPFVYGDGMTHERCRSAFYCEDSKVECTGWVVAS